MEDREVLATLRAHVASCHNHSSNEAGTTDALNPGAVEKLSAEVWNASHSVGELNPRNPGFLNELIQSSKKLVQRAMGWYTRPLQVFHCKVAQAIEEHGRAINALHEQLLYLSNNNPTIIALDEAMEAARLTTQEQQSPFVRLFQGLSPVVDLGCGRGEFLELLRDAGIESYGVDSDPSACEAARRKHLTIVEGDVFQFLKQLPERSVGGFFSSRLIEYISPHKQSEFVRLCSDKLKPGGRIVVETINPDSDSPFGRNWRLDPSHLHTVYAEVLRSVLESSDFQDTQICILAPHVISLTSTDAAAPRSGNGRGGEILVKPSVTGAPAYAAIGTRF